MNTGPYLEFLSSKVTAVPPCGFDIGEDRLISRKLAPFQRALVKWACRLGRAAVFADTGLGKTWIQVEWARQVADYTHKSVLIAAPLCVAQQTVAEGAKFDRGVEYVRAQPKTLGSWIWITNYEMLDHFDLDSFAGIVLDESSILKHLGGKTREDLIRRAANIPYRLSCTATPAPNDFMEFGGQSAFLGILSQAEMLATYFTHDGGDTSKWRLKGHGRTKFWQWLASWAVYLKRPSDLGFDDTGYDLPPLRFHEHIVESTEQAEGTLFLMQAETLQERIAASRKTVEARVAECVRVVADGEGQWLVWCHRNAESEGLTRAIPGAVEVTGSMPVEEKERRILSFLAGKSRILVTKPSIAGFGLNMQHCAKMAFVGLNDSYEEFYQAVRRCWRFGQARPVNVHIIASELEGAVLANIKRKEHQAEMISTQMVESMGGFENMADPVTERRADYRQDVAVGESWELRLGDCVDVTRSMPDESVDFTLFSPPFSNLYTYSASERDMGNCRMDSEFLLHFQFLLGALYRVTLPGRHVAFHCFNIPTMKQRGEEIGIQDFRGDLIRAFREAGFIYHSEVCIWKDPVTAMQRTKALGLLHKTIRKDSSMARVGLPDYVVTMRKPGRNPKPIAHNSADFPVSLWQEIASPIWMNINPSKTLNRNGAREADDERHIAPLQLEVIERCLMLWSAPDDLVYSPFAGIGSEGYVALQMGRRFLGVELKPSYWEIAKRHLAAARSLQGGLFRA